MPSTEIELGHGYESLHRILHLGYGEKRFGVCHEAILPVSTCRRPEDFIRYTLCYALQHRPRFEDKGGQSYPAQIGARPQLGYNMGEHWALCC